MSHYSESMEPQSALHVSFGPETADTAPPLDRAAALEEIQQLMDRWRIGLAEVVDPAERQAAIGNARRLMAFWKITPEELEGPLPPPAARRPQYLYTHPKTGETWDGLGTQPAWLRRCLINEGYRLDEVRRPYAVN